MKPELKWDDLLRAVTGDLDAPARQALLQQAITLGPQVSPDTVGCSVTEMDGLRYRTPVASGELAMALDQAQYDACTGPCVVAARDRQQQQIDVMDDQHSFAEFAASALTPGVHSSLSIPLTGTERPAAINLYAASKSAFDDARPHAVAALLARCIAALLPPQSEPVQPVEVIASRADLELARARGDLVIRAQNALVAGERISPAEAFVLLAQLSRSENLSVADVAANLLAETESEFSE